MRHEATFAVVCRARHYAGRWIIAPEARLDSDPFEVLLFAHRDRAQPLPPLPRDDAPAAASTSRPASPAIVRGRRVAIRSLEPYPVDIQVDGDCVLKTPVECHVDAAFVNILAPRR